MLETVFDFPAPFIKKSTKSVVEIILLDKKEAKTYTNDQLDPVRRQIEQADFSGKAGQFTVIRDEDGLVQSVLIGYDESLNHYTLSPVYAYLSSNFGAAFLGDVVFKMNEDNLDQSQINKLCIGWALGDYKYDTSITRAKNAKKTKPMLVWPKDVHADFVTAQISAMCLLRNLVNTPANMLGTDELCDAAKEVAKPFKAKVKVIKDDDLVKKNFPMIYEVGKASPRRPQLIDMTWGKKTDPKVTIVGKGIIYDTGGLNIKTGTGMRQMKKDMGGAAHALGLAHMIMALKLPIQLRVLIPAAENAIAGNAYRPGDIIMSRKGLTVEVDDTDAEGRLVLADTLTYACEDEPDLLVDFATLTGAARVAIGYDIPAFFSNRDHFLDELRHSSVEASDFIWPFPLWDGYDQNVDGTVSDIVSVGRGRAGHIEAALFLQRFIESKTDWIHLDCYAWEQNGKAGRPQGGADTGMLALFSMIEKRYNA